LPSCRQRPPPGSEDAATVPPISDLQCGLGELAIGPTRGSVIESYAYARSAITWLDALRRNGWKGFGPVPWSHAPNQGFLRCLAALAGPPVTSGDRRAERCGILETTAIRPPRRAG